ncbi:uncharacterized protein AB9X84_011413 isoform 3-T4 [Acanthopagrus schlegelii]
MTASLEWLPWKPGGTGKRNQRRRQEDRWRKLYPEIKKCVIVIARLRLDRAKVKLKQVKNGERMSVEGPRRGAGEPSPDWMEPVELDDSDCEGGLRSFVKKLRVRVRGNYAAANGSRKPRGRPRGAGLLRLGQCQSCDVTADPVDITDPAILMERWRQFRLNDKQISISQSEAYSLNFKAPDTPDRPNGQSQDASPLSSCDHKDGGTCSCSTETENPLSIVFKKEVTRRWRRRRRRRTWGRRKVKREPEDDSWTPPLAKVADEEAKQKTNQPERKQRRQACGHCAACLREDCGKCLYCLNKRKFGGPQRKKQRCQLRLCLVVESKFRPRPPLTNLTVTMATKPQHHQWKRGRDEKEEELRNLCCSQLYAKAAKTRMQRWGGGRATPQWMKEESGGGEKKKGKKNSPSAQSLFSLLGGGAMDEVICGRSLLRLLRVLRRTVLPAHWVPVLTAGPLLQLLKCSKLSSMSDTIVHVHPDHCFYITVQSRLLPDTQSVHNTHTEDPTPQPGNTHTHTHTHTTSLMSQLCVCVSWCLWLPRPASPVCPACCRRRRRR